MQVKELKQEGLNYSFEITVEQTEIDAQLNSKLEEYAKTAKLPGFRAGKVPVAIMRQRYGKSILGEVLEKAVNDSSVKALSEKGLRPAMQPKIEVTQFDEDKDLTYTIEFEVIPTVDVVDLKTIKLDRLVTVPGGDAVEEALSRVAQGYSSSEIVTTKRAAKEGDIVKIDFDGRTKADDVHHDGMKAEGHMLELGSGQFIPGFEEQLIGKKAGDEVAVEVKFPDQYQAEHLAGQAAIFDVVVHEIHEKKAAEIDDEFAKKLGLEDKAALLEAVKGQLQNEYDQYSRMKIKRSLLDLLDEKHDFDVPAGMHDMEFQTIKQQISMENAEKVVDGELDLSDEEKDELYAIAKRRVKLGVILSEVGNANNIQINDHELQRAVIQEAQKYPGQEAQVFEYYKSNQQALEALRAPVFEDKVVDFILEMADITEKEVDLATLTAEDEEPYEDKSSKKTTKAKSSTAKKPAAKKASDDKAPAKKPAAKKASTAKKPAAKKSESKEKSAAKK